MTSKKETERGDTALPREPQSEGRHSPASGSPSLRDTAPPSWSSSLRGDTALPQSPILRGDTALPQGAPA